MKTPERTILNQFFSPQPLDQHISTNWSQPAIGFNLIVFVIVKFILEVIAISCPVPAGVFAPTFILGAGFGRMYGYFLRQLIGPTINEATYSIIGAACVTASVTRTVSVAMIVFELNGELSYMIPLLMSVLLSYAISQGLAMSIFDVLLDMKDLPYLPALSSVEHYHMTAKNIMSKNFLYLTKDSELSDIIVLLQHLGPRAKSIPIVNSDEDKLLMYSVQAQSLRKYLFQYYTAVSHTFDTETRNKLNKYFYSIYSISDNKVKEFTKGKHIQDEEALAFFNPSYHARKQSKDAGNHRSSGLNVELHKKESMLKVREFNTKLINSQFQDEKSDDSISDDFWVVKINYDHEMLEVDKAPFTVFEDASLAKIHFLFTMLNLDQLFVIKNGNLVGIITKNEFLKRKRMAIPAKPVDVEMPVYQPKKETPQKEVPVVEHYIQINEESLEESPVKGRHGHGRKL